MNEIRWSAMPDGTLLVEWDGTRRTGSREGLPPIREGSRALVLRDGPGFMVLRTVPRFDPGCADPGCPTLLPDGGHLHKCLPRV